MTSTNTATAAVLELAREARGRNDAARSQIYALLSLRLIPPDGADVLAFSLKDVPALAAAVEALARERDEALTTLASCREQRDAVTDELRETSAILRRKDESEVDA